MKAVSFNAYGGPEVLQQADHPAPVPGAGEMLIRIEAIGVNPADGKWRAGKFSKTVPLQLPHIPGYDIAGTVVAPGDTGLAAGSRVAALLHAHRQGGYAEYAVAGTPDIAVIPDELDFVRAAAIPTPGLTGLQLIEDQLDARPSQLLLITGATGTVGRFAMFAARARRVRIVALVRENYREEALALGAEIAIIPGEVWRGEPFDHVADTIGGPQVAELCRHLRPGGLIRTVATTPIPAAGLATPPTFFPVRRDAAQLARLVEAAAKRQVTVPVALTLPLERAAEAQRLIENGGLGGKIVLQP